MKNLLTSLKTHLLKYFNVGGQFGISFSSYLFFVSNFKIGWLVLISMIGKDILMCENLKNMFMNIISDVIAFIIVTFLIYLFRERLIRIFYKTKHSIYPYFKIKTQQIKFDENVLKECSLDFKLINDKNESIFRYEDLRTCCNFYNENDDLVGCDELNLEFTEESIQRFPILKDTFEQNKPLKFFIKRSDLYRLSQQNKHKYKLLLRFISNKPSHDYYDEIDITNIIRGFSNTQIFPINTSIKLISYTEKWLNDGDNNERIEKQIINQNPDLFKRD